MATYKFKDGDVDFILSPREEHQFRLHAQVLREGSEFLAEILTKENEALLGLQARRQGKVLYHIELNEGPGPVHKVGKLTRMELNDKGLLATTNPPSIAFTNENGKVPKVHGALYQNYKNCIAAMYNKPLVLGDRNSNKENSLPKIISEIFGLLDVAQYLGCVTVVARAVEIILLSHGQHFFRTISKTPTVWVNQAYRMKSPAIFREAVIHCVGQWNSLPVPAKKMLTKEVLPLLRTKVEQMEKRGKELESKIISTYPRSVQRTEGDNNNATGYKADVFFWIAIGFFRHWFGQQVVGDRGPRALDGGWQFYNTLQQGASAYLDRTNLNVFHNRFHMSKKGSGVIENHILELKELVKEKVIESKLMTNESQMDLSKHEIKYLVSCRFGNNDYPWKAEAEKAAPVTTPKKRSSPVDEEAEENEDEEEDAEMEDEEEEEEAAPEVASASKKARKE